MSVDIRNAQVNKLNVGPTIITEGLMASWNAASVHSYPRTGSVWYGSKSKQWEFGKYVGCKFY